jgi:DNA-binding HxlR family transcriptional regulator
MNAQTATPALSETRPGYIRANSVSRALTAIGDRWSLLILAAAFQGTHRFEEWRVGIGIASNILTTRLERLVKIGCLRRAAVSGGARRQEYRLTPMGADIYPTALMFWRFDRLWARRRGGQPATLTHTPCGKLMSPVCACGKCHAPVRAREVRYQDGPGAGFDRMPPPKRSRRSAITLDDGASLQMLIGESIDMIGDRWTQQVLSTFFLGARRFEEIRARCNVAPNILSDRLKLLVGHGMLQRRVCATSPRHFEYVLTPKGLDVYPMLLTLMKWGDRWLAGKAGPPLILRCGHCGSVLDPVVLCDQCGGELDPHQVTFRRP